MLFYYIIGRSALGLFALIVVGEAILSLPSFTVLGETMRDILLSFTVERYHTLTVFANFLPEDKSAIIAHNAQYAALQSMAQNSVFYSVPFLVGTLYLTAVLGYVMALLSCRFLIRKKIHVSRLQALH